MPIKFQRAKVPDPTNLIENDIAITQALYEYGSLSIEHPCIETGCSRGGLSRSDSETSDGLRTTGHFRENAFAHENTVLRFPPRGLGSRLKSKRQPPRNCRTLPRRLQSAYSASIPARAPGQPDSAWINAELALKASVER